MLDSYPFLKEIKFPAISRNPLKVLQINLGYKCNLQCLHCHVNASPKRTEVMSSQTLEYILVFIKKYKIKEVDLTGGAPEMHPNFEYFITQLAKLKCSIIVRTNLVILMEEKYQHLVDFFVKFNVTLTASLPCYLEENVDKQRGQGTFDKSIHVLKELNEKGYGKSTNKLQLNLVFNPQGPELPGEQLKLQADYKNYLDKYFNIQFNQLFTITNQPIKRFGSMLISKKQFNSYMNLLKVSYDELNLENLMCKTIISVDWKGYIFDCDFNQMLDLPITNNNNNLHISNYHPINDEQIPIQVAGHCYACTAGSGSSCGGTLT